MNGRAVTTVSSTCWEAISLSWQDASSDGLGDSAHMDMASAYLADALQYLAMQLAANSFWWQ